VHRADIGLHVPNVYKFWEPLTSCSPKGLSRPVMWYLYRCMERWLNYTDRGKQIIGEQPVLVPLHSRKTRQTGPRCNPDLRGDRQTLIAQSMAPDPLSVLECIFLPDSYRFINHSRWNTYWTKRQDNSWACISVFECQQGQEMFLFSETSRPIFGPPKTLPIQ
jgi:hypothetical protein